MMRQRAHRRARPAGFTLVELLVAVAILMTLMSGVVLLFVGSLRTVQQGYQAMDAGEVARATLRTFEADAVTCFGSKAAGTEDNFFGLPTACMFISTAGPPERQRMSRISYVLHEYQPMDDPRFPACPYGPTVGGRHYEGTVTVTVPKNVLDPSLGTTTQQFEAEARVRSLIRYVEHDVRNMDTYAFTWPDPFGGAAAMPEVGSPERAVWDELQAVVIRGGVDLRDYFPQGSARDLATEALVAELLKAKKRELWLRMLAGDPTLPDIWMLLGKNPRDYVVCEHVLWQFGPLPGAAAPPYVWPRDVYRNFEFANDNTWQPSALIAEAVSGQRPFEQEVYPDGTAYGIFQYVKNYYQVTESLDMSGNLVPNPEKYWPLVNKPVSYYHTEMNLPYGGALGSAITGVMPDLDVFWDNQDFTCTTVPEPEPRTTSTTPGNLLDPALPEAVRVAIRLWYPRPYPNAPDYSRVFSTTISLPMALLRSQSESPHDGSYVITGAE